VEFRWKRRPSRCRKNIPSSPGRGAGEGKKSHRWLGHLLFSLRREKWNRKRIPLLPTALRSPGEREKSASPKRFDDQERRESRKEKGGRFPSSRPRRGRRKGTGDSVFALRTGGQGSFVEEKKQRAAQCGWNHRERKGNLVVHDAVAGSVKRGREDKRWGGREERGEITLLCCKKKTSSGA